jgi:hypothetical protein
MLGQHSAVGWCGVTRAHTHTHTHARARICHNWSMISLPLVFSLFACVQPVGQPFPTAAQAIMDASGLWGSGPKNINC